MVWVGTPKQIYQIRGGGALADFESNLEKLKVLFKKILFVYFLECMKNTSRKKL